MSKPLNPNSNLKTLEIGPFPPSSSPFLPLPPFLLFHPTGGNFFSHQWEIFFSYQWDEFSIPLVGIWFFPTGGKKIFPTRENSPVWKFESQFWEREKERERERERERGGILTRGKDFFPTSGKKSNSHQWDREFIPLVRKKYFPLEGKKIPIGGMK